MKDAPKVSKWADASFEHVKSKPSYGQAVQAHERCNYLLERLRSGNRRRTYGHVRALLRTYRARLVKKFQLPKGRYAA